MKTDPSFEAKDLFASAEPAPVSPSTQPMAEPASEKSEEPNPYDLNQAVDDSSNSTSTENSPLLPPEPLAPTVPAVEESPDPQPPTSQTPPNETEQPQSTEPPVQSQSEQLQPTGTTGRSAAEILRDRPCDADELVRVVGELSYSDQRLQKLEQKYGSGFLGTLKQRLAGELDIQLNEADGRADWNKVNEIGRKAFYSVFNRRTMAATGVGVTLGVLTGGVGWASLGVIYGSAVGRAGAEIFSIAKGGERGARAQMLQQERAAWNEARQLVVSLNQTTDLTQRAEIIGRINDLFAGKDKKVVNARLKFEEEGKSLNKLRNLLQTVGEVGGGALGIGKAFLAGNFSGLDIDLWHRVPGQQIFHQVVNNGHGWNYAVGMGEAFAKGAHYGVFNGQVIHALGEPTWKIAAASLGEQVLPLLLGAHISARQGEKIEAGAKAKEQEYRAKQAEIDYKRVKESIPQPPTEADLRKKYSEMALEHRKGLLPAQNERWILPPKPKEKIRGRLVKIKEILWSARGGPQVSVVERVKMKVMGKNEIEWVATNVPLDQLLRDYSNIGPEKGETTKKVESSVVSEAQATIEEEKPAASAETPSTESTAGEINDELASKLTAQLPKDPVTVTFEKKGNVFKAWKKIGDWKKPIVIHLTTEEKDKVKVQALNKNKISQDVICDRVVKKTGKNKEEKKYSYLAIEAHLKPEESPTTS